MSELLLEFFSEEIPSRMQARAADDLARLVTTGLDNAGLTFGRVNKFVTPRRLTLVIDDVPATSCDVREERKGPRVDAPEAALQGFLRSTGLTIDECEIRDDKKGQVYIAVIDRKGRPTELILSEVITEVVRNFPWPKAMRWGTGRLKWVRPLHSIVCVHDGKPVKFLVDGVDVSNVTQGHRFLGGEPFKVKSFADYKEQLKENYVILDAVERADIILKDAKDLAKNKKLTLVEDKALLSEVAGLVEWPVALMGSFDKAFLDVPEEALIAAMKKHQKSFSVKKNGRLTNRFILVANLASDDEGVAIIEGNERVIRARLSDAKFFWDNDKKTKLDDLRARLGEIVFHAKLGSVLDRCERLERLGIDLAPLVGAEVEPVKEAAKIAKADLVTDTVIEAADMQGVAGRYLALNEGRSEDIADAIGDHYKPLGPSDDIPKKPLSIALALAEKLDTLICFWAIDEKPTGSKDPFALRRAALGIIRIILENELRLSLKPLISQQQATWLLGAETGTKLSATDIDALVDDLLSFFADRLKVYLRDKGERHDLIDAVFALGDQDDLLMIVKRVEALRVFLETEDGGNLLAGVKRAQNILKIEEKKDKQRYDGDVDKALLVANEEKALLGSIQTVSAAVSKAVKQEDFATAMAEIAKLRQPIDAFFDQVTVNDEDSKVRANRLALLGLIRQETGTIADFSKIEG